MTLSRRDEFAKALAPAFTLTAPDGTIQIDVAGCAHASDALIAELNKTAPKEYGMNTEKSSCEHGSDERTPSGRCGACASIVILKSKERIKQLTEAIEWVCASTLLPNWREELRRKAWL